MRRRSGCFSRILTTFIVLGIIAGGLLFYLGYQKADKAEADHGTVVSLYSTYVGANDYGLDPTTTNLIDSLIANAIDDDSFTGKIYALFKGHPVSSLVVKAIYLPDDDTISTAIGQRILVSRLEKQYDDNELLLIYCYATGYSVNDLTGAASLLDEEAKALIDSEVGTSLENLVSSGVDFIEDTLGDLVEMKLLSPEKAEAIKGKLPVQ